MRLHNYETTLNVNVDVIDGRLAESEEQAVKFAEGDVRKAIRYGLSRELNRPKTTIEITVENVQKKER